MIQPGTRFELSFPVTPEVTALRIGSGTLEVLATPVLAAKLEECAWRAAEPFLPDGSSTVGTHLDLKHLSPTPVGMTVTCAAEVISAEGRVLTFSLRAWDGAGPVAEGSHARVEVQNARFLDKARKKLAAT